MEKFIIAFWMCGAFSLMAQQISPTPTSLSLEIYQVDSTVTYFNVYYVNPSSGTGIFGYDSTDQYYSNFNLGTGLSYNHSTHTIGVDPTALGLGSAAFQNTSAFATASQGTKADSALQSSNIGSSIQAYSSNLNTFSSNGSAYYLSRANATGTQTASTISDFTTTALTAVTWSTLTGKPSFATVATTGAYSDLTGKPTIPSAQIQSDWTQASTGSLDYIKNKPAARSQSTATHSFVSSTSSTGFQVSSTRDSEVNYSFTISTTATIGGASSGTVFLEIAATNSTTPSDWTTIAKFTNGQTITLAVALQSVQTMGGQLSGYIPLGYYARLRTLNNSGTPSYNYEVGQETLL